MSAPAPRAFWDTGKAKDKDTSTATATPTPSASAKPGLPPPPTSTAKASSTTSTTTSTATTTSSKSSTPAPAPAATKTSVDAPRRHTIKLPEPKALSSKSKSSHLSVDNTTWRNERGHRASEANVSTGKIAEINEIIDAEISKVTDWKKKDEKKFLLDEIISEEAIGEIFKTYDGDNDSHLNQRELAQFLGHDLGFLAAVAESEAAKILNGAPEVNIGRCIEILKERYGLRVQRSLTYPRIVESLGPVGTGKGAPQDFDLVEFATGRDSDSKETPAWKNKILAAIEEAEFDTACWKKACSILRDRLAFQTHQTTRAWLRCCHEMEVVRNLTAAIRKIDNQAKIIQKIEEQTADEVGFGVSLEVAEQIRRAKDDERKKWEEVVEKAKDDVERMQQATTTELMNEQADKFKQEMDNMKTKHENELKEREAVFSETTVSVDEYSEVQELLETLNTKYNETFDQYEAEWKHSRQLEEEVERLEREKQRLQSELDLQKRRPVRATDAGGLVREKFKVAKPGAKKTNRATKVSTGKEAEEKIRAQQAAAAAAQQQQPPPARGGAPTRN